MKLKDGVKFGEEMHSSMWYARAVIGELHRELYGHPGTITSALRPQSNGGSSLHPAGRAIDVRVWSMRDAQEQQKFAREARLRLGDRFDVIVEGPAAELPQYKDRPPHIHIEWDDRTDG